MMYRGLPVVEYRYCLCGSYMMQAFPEGTRPLVKKRRFRGWERQHQGEGHAHIDRNAYVEQRIKEAWEKTIHDAQLLQMPRRTPRP